MDGRELTRARDAEKLMQGERRYNVDRRSSGTPPPPSDEQLALFARRMKRALRDEKGRGFFGVANGEQEFAIYPDVIRTVDWIERLSEGKREQQAEGRANPSLRKAVASETTRTEDAINVETEQTTSK